MADVPNTLMVKVGERVGLAVDPSAIRLLPKRRSMSRPLLIAQISDLHIKRPGELAYGQVDTAAALTRCVVALNRFRPRPQLVVISGDLADTPEAEEYEHLKRLLAPLEMPFVAVPGNHDNRELMRAALPERRLRASKRRAQFAARGRRARSRAARIRACPGKPHGELDGETLAWLDATLASSSTRPALIFLHHPPFVTGIEHMDVQNLRNAAALGDDSAAPSTRAPGGRRPRPSRHADPIRRHARRRSVRRPTMRSRSISKGACRRRSRSSRRPFTCTPGLPVKT